MIAMTSPVAIAWHVFAKFLRTFYTLYEIFMLILHFLRITRYSNCSLHNHLCYIFVIFLDFHTIYCR